MIYVLDREAEALIYKPSLQINLEVRNIMNYLGSWAGENIRWSTKSAIGPKGGGTQNSLVIK